MDYFSILDNNKNKNKNKKEKHICRGCKKESLINDDGSFLCNACGLNNGPIINYGDDNRYYGSSDCKYTSDPSRTGMPINPYAPKSSLGIIISGNKYHMYGIKTLHMWYCSTNYKEKSFLNASQFMEDVLTNNNVYIPTNIKDKSKLLYKMVSKQSIKRGSLRKAFMATCFYYACKYNNFSLTKKKLSVIFNIKLSKITHSCKIFHEIINTGKNDNFLKKISPSNYNDLIKEYGDLMEIDIKIQLVSLVISKIADELGIISENTPSSIAIGTLYFVLNYYNKNISKKILSSKCLISEVTICKTFKKLKENIQYLKPILDKSIHKYIDINDNAKYIPDNINID